MDIKEEIRNLINWYEGRINTLKNIDLSKEHSHNYYMNVSKQLINDDLEKITNTKPNIEKTRYIELCNIITNCYIELTEFIKRFELEADLTELNKLSIGQLNSAYAYIFDKLCTKIIQHPKSNEGYNLYLTLIECLDVISNFKIALHKTENNLKHCNDSAMYCQYIISIINKHLDNKPEQTPEQAQKIQELKKESFKKLSQIHKLILDAAGVKDKDIKELTEKNIDEFSGKKQLNAIRKEVKKWLEAVDRYSKDIKNIDDRIITGTQKLSKEITCKMKEYLQNLHQKAEEVLGEPPCKYAVIGLGSMAMGQITPYSDLEFAILIEDGKDKDPNILNYFKNLSAIVQFKVILLGETPIPTSYYGINMDNLIKLGVNLDLGGKVPLGKEGKYELICTTEKMMQYVRDEKNKDKNLPYILEKPCFVYGDKSLYEEYLRCLTDYLCANSSKDPNMTNAEVRWKEVFLKGRSEISNGTKHQTMSDKDFYTLDTFDYSPFNIKNMYRLVTLSIKNLRAIFCEKVLVWATDYEVIDLLYSRKKITKEAQENLKKALSFINCLRNKVYYHYDSQKDFAAYSLEDKTLILKNDISNIITNIPVEDFYDYYIISLSLEEKLKQYYTNSKNLNKEELKKKLFYNTNFYDNEFITRAKANIKILQVDKAIQELLSGLLELKKQNETKNLQKKDILYVTNIFDMIISICNYQYIRPGEKEINLYKTVSDKVRNWLKNPGEDFFNIIDNINSACFYYHKYCKLQEFYKTVFKLYKILYPKDIHPDINTILENNEIKINKEPDHYIKY